MLTPIIVSACDKFIYIEILGAKPATGTPSGRKTSPELQRNAKLVRLLRSAIASASAEDGWANLGPIGSHIQKARPDFDSRNYGYSKLSGLIEAIGLFETQRQNNHLLVRDPEAG